MKLDSDNKGQINIEINKSEDVDFDAFGLLSLLKGEALPWARFKAEQERTASGEGVLLFTYICENAEMSILKHYVEKSVETDVKKLVKSYSEFVIKNDMAHYLTQIDHVFTDGEEVYLIYTPFARKELQPIPEIIEEFLEKLCYITGKRLSDFEALTQVLSQGECSLDQILEALSKSGERTNSAGYDYDKTTLLQDYTVMYDTPNLLRVSTNEKIYFTKRNFVVGKSRSHADYTIENNVAISRVHAQFNSENDNYFVVDKGSTNKTFVNGYMIAPNIPVKIVDGDEIRLADEFFIFHLN